MIKESHLILVESQVITNSFDTLPTSFPKQHFLVDIGLLLGRPLIGKTHSVPRIEVLKIFGAMHELRSINDLMEIPRIYFSQAQNLYNGVFWIPNFVLASSQPFLADRGKNHPICNKCRAAIMPIMNSEDVSYHGNSPYLYSGVFQTATRTSLPG